MLIQCPECQKQLKLSVEPVLGKQVHCPGCQHAFDPLAQNGAAAIDSLHPVSVAQPSKTGLEKSLIGLVICVVVGVVGLNLWKMVGAGAPANAPIAAVPTVNAGPAITDAEVQEFCQKLESAVKEEQQPMFQQLWNFGAILEKTLTGVDLSERDKEEFKRGAAASLPAFAGQIFEQSRMGSYEYLNTRESDTGVKQVTFRLQSDEGLNYHRFDLVRNDAGAVAAGDVHIATSGEYFSTTMRRIVLPLAASANRSLLDRMQGSESELIENFPKIQQIQGNTQAGNGGAALSIYNSLPASLQHQKFMLLLRLAASQQVGDEEYVRTMEMFMKHHPGDVCLNLLSIDYYIYKERFDECQTAIQKLDESVGGDPYLKILQAGVLNTSGDSPAARKLLEPFLENEAFAERAYGILLDVVLADDDHEGTVKTLNVLENQYGYDFGDIRQTEDFSRFVQTDEYQEWNKTR